MGSGGRDSDRDSDGDGAKWSDNFDGRDDGDKLDSSAG